jgi:APA family basic amino acid/polyamine antiporter
VIGERDDGAQPGVRARLRSGSEVAEARIERGLGVPAVLVVAGGAVGAAIFFALGIVAKDALGLTPLAFLAAGVFLLLSTLSYLEGSSLHPERGGASTFARYAFDELWSFVAGWAILLDFLIVMAIGALAVSGYMAVFWGGFDDAGAQLAIAALVLAGVAVANVRGQMAERYRLLLRLLLVTALLLAGIVVAGLLGHHDLEGLLDSIDLGTAPTWEDLVFAAVIASVPLTGISSASGLAGEVRVRRGALRRVVVVAFVGLLVLYVGIALVAVLAVPVRAGETALGGEFLAAPLVGVTEALEPEWLSRALRYAVGVTGVLVLAQAVNGQMLGIGRLAYALGTNRQIPSVVSRLDVERGTPYITIALAAVLGFALAASADIEWLIGIFAFGATLAFTLAHLSIVVLRFREPERPRAFRVPLSIPVARGSIPIPSALGALTGAAAWALVIAFHEGARYVGLGWMLAGLSMYVVYRRVNGLSLTKRATMSEAVLRESRDVEFGSILVPVFGEPLDDEIVGTAGRLAAEHAEEGEGDGGAILEALWVFPIPMSLPIDARVPEERIAQARGALARAKRVGEEYAGVQVATAMVRGRTTGATIVAEARRRGVEAIVLAAEAPTRIRGGGILGGRGIGGDRFAGDLTRYVVEKAPCKVILTAPPGEGDGDGGLAPPEPPAAPGLPR